MRVALAQLSDLFYDLYKRQNLKPLKGLRLFLISLISFASLLIIFKGFALKLFSSSKSVVEHLLTLYILSVILLFFINMWYFVLRYLHRLLDLGSLGKLISSRVVGIIIGGIHFLLGGASLVAGKVADAYMESLTVASKSQAIYSLKFLVIVAFVAFILNSFLFLSDHSMSRETRERWRRGFYSRIIKRTEVISSYRVFKRFMGAKDPELGDLKPSIILLFFDLSLMTISGYMFSLVRLSEVAIFLVVNIVSFIYIESSARRKQYNAFKSLKSFLGRLSSGAVCRKCFSKLISPPRDKVILEIALELTSARYWHPGFLWKARKLLSEMRCRLCGSNEVLFNISKVIGFLSGDGEMRVEGDRLYIPLLRREEDGSLRVIPADVDEIELYPISGQSGFEGDFYLKLLNQVIIELDRRPHLNLSEVTLKVHREVLPYVSSLAKGRFKSLEVIE